MRNTFIGILTCLLALGACQPARQPLPAGPELQDQCVQALTEVIVHDIFTPPVASRLYAYTQLAYYEALRPANPAYASLLPQLRGFAALPAAPDSVQCHYALSAATAFLKVAEALVFSKDSIRQARLRLLAPFDQLPDDVRARSAEWGEAVAAVVLARAAADNYKQTRGMPRYSVFKDAGRWTQTPPEYADAVEPHWRLIAPLRMDSAAQCQPPPPPAYSSDSSSTYYLELREVYQVTAGLTAEQDSIAYYWDDNPFVVEHKGHFTMANKKITPVGHWMGIAGILCGRYAKGDAVKVAQVYALTAAAIFDGFISCWHEKYKSRTVRPVTVIREWIAPTWEPRLQTPPFPEYTSGHSVISAAAEEVLTAAFGEVPFTDTTEMPYLGMQRTFASARAASAEAGISRLYGGIHFRAAIEAGKVQGEQVGQLFVPLLRK